MDMSHEFTPSGEGSKNNKLATQPEQQITAANYFDKKIKKLFADKSDQALERAETALAPHRRFTDEWWEELYKWCDGYRINNAYFQLSEDVVDKLASFPKDAKLPKRFNTWASEALKNPEKKARILDTLNNRTIPPSLRSQIPTLLAQEPSIWSLDVILKGYKLFGEPVGQEMRKNIIPLFMVGLAVQDVFDANKDVLVKLCAAPASHKESKKTDVRTASKSSSIVSRVSRYLSPSTFLKSPERKRQEAEKRMVAIRDLVRELYPVYEKYYNTKEEFSRNIHDRLFSLTEDESNTMHSFSDYEQEITQRNYSYKESQDALSLPIDTLERYLSDLRHLNAMPGFEEGIRGKVLDRASGILPPYTALGRAATGRVYGVEIPFTSVINHLNELDKSGNLDDRIVDEILFGIYKELFSGDEIKIVGRRNLRILIKYQLPQATSGFRLYPLLTISEENVLKDGLETSVSIQERDNTTAVLLLEALPKFRAFGDKHKVVLDYVKRKREREDLRRIRAIKHEDYVSEALKTIELTDSGARQGERLVKLAISLDAISELNELLQLGISDTGIVPDLRTSYENVQNTLRGILQKLGIANLDEAYKFLPFLKTKDETALKVLRGEEVTKIGEARSYDLQAGSKFDLEGMKKEIEGYAQTIGIELSEVPVEDLNLESLKQMAGYVFAELSKRKDISEEVLREIKPNLDRIRTAMDKGGIYTFSINPQDMKAQLEALQNVGSCLSPGGSMFRYTKEYLRNPNTSWATIKGGQGIVGRVTMFRGTDEKGNPAIARVSIVYAQVPIDENEVDEALRNYSAETNASFVERGKLTVPGLQEFYDDFIGTGRGSVVAINR